MGKMDKMDKMDKRDKINRVELISLRLPMAETAENQIQTLMEHVSPARRERILRYRNASGRICALYAGLLVRMELSLRTGLPSDLLRFTLGPQGKPRCETVPWLEFNLSHTAGFLLCAISSCGAVGVDTERLERKYQEGLLRRFHKNEQERYHACATEAERRYCFFELWTRKEAFGKCLGTGLAWEILGEDTRSEIFSQHAVSFQQENYLCSAYTEAPDAQWATFSRDKAEVSAFFYGAETGIKRDCGH